MRLNLFFVIVLAAALFLGIVSFVRAENSLNQTVSREHALDALNESFRVVNKMQKDNFSIAYVNDSLAEARRLFIQAGYAAILRGEVNASASEQNTARQALQLIDWKTLDYGDVIALTETILEREKEALGLSDSLNAFAIDAERMYGTTWDTLNHTSIQLFLNAQRAFYEDRYSDARTLLRDTQNAFDREQAESTTLVTLKKNAQTFFLAHWRYISLGLIIAILGGRIVYKKSLQKIRKSRIRAMRLERETLIALIKKTQTARFKDNRISSLVYATRMTKYKERLEEISQQLPVLESLVASKRPKA